jgi:hypothetical protein
MAARNIKKSISELESILGDWVKFKNYLYPNLLTKQQEDDFRNVLSSLTGKNRIFMEIIEIDMEEAHKMVDILSKISGPREAARINPASLQNIENDWNNIYILIQESLGVMDYRLEVKRDLWKPWHWFRKSGSKKDLKQRDVYHIKPVKNNDLIYILKLILTLMVLAGLIMFLYSFGILERYINF